MASYSLQFRKSVAKDLEGVPRADVRKIMERIRGLMTDPRPPGSVKLSGQEYYRVRQGNYRIVYEIRDAEVIVIVIKIGHRREVYR